MSIKKKFIKVVISVLSFYCMIHMYVHLFGY